LCRLKQLLERFVEGGCLGVVHLTGFDDTADSLPTRDE